MRRLWLFLSALVWVTLGMAQERQGLFLYRNNGDIDIHYTQNIDSIFYSYYDLEGNRHPEAVTQVIRGGRYQYKTPLAEIDSISFTHPDPFQMRRAGKLNPITGKAFRSLVWDYQEHPGQLVFKGERPVVMDYWAPWCGYCMQMMPLVQQLAQEYKGKVDFYKVNTDDEIELSNVLGMTSLPCFYFYPKKGEPVVYMGSMDLASMRKIIDEVLLITDDEDVDAEKPTMELKVWKGDGEQEWTDRKVTAQIRCTSQNATLVKYGCFLQEDYQNSGLTEREMVQNYGQVLPENLLAEINGGKGVTLSFPVKKGQEYVMICMMKNEQGGVAVEQARVMTDAQYQPLLEFQAQRGALEDLMEPGQKYISLYMKGKAATAVSYCCMTAADYQQALEQGDSRRTLLEKEGIPLTAQELALVNDRGFTVVVGGLLPETDYVCMAMAQDAQGKVTTTLEEVTTPFDGYDDHIGYPEAGLVTTLFGHSVSCSVNCASGDAIYAALLKIPSDELSKLLASGKTLEEVMDSHSDVSVFTDQQMEWINGQGISNVYTDLSPETRYTWVVDLRGRFGGRTVKRSEVKTLAQGVEAPIMNVQLNASYQQGMLNASATCTTGNATAAKAALLESAALESMLASGKTLEEVMEGASTNFLSYIVFSEQQIEWFNQYGYILGCSEIKMNTRYTWILDAQVASGEHVVLRSEVQTPKK